MVSPSSTSLNGSAATANVAVITTAAAAMGFTRPYGGPLLRKMLGFSSALFGSLVLMALASLLGWRRERRPRWTYGPAFLLLFAMGFAVNGCGGGNSSRIGGGETPNGTYTLTVTGTFASGSTTLTHATTFTLVVQ